MGKVKSAIITALLVAAILVLALFATISCNVPGSNGVDRYNSFMSMIPLGRDLTGGAATVLYPEGVLNDSDYNFVVSDEDEANSEKREEYLDKYVQKGSLWIDKEKLGEDDGAEFAESVKADAKIISDRLSQKGYSSYSVAVLDNYAIKLTVPTGLSYSAYKMYDSTSYSNALYDKINHAVTYLTYQGELSLRDSSTYKGSNSLLSINDAAFSTYIKSAQPFARGGTYALRINLTKEGFNKLNDVLSSGSGTAYLFIGETNLQLTFTMGEELSDRTLYFQMNSSKYAKEYSEDYATVIDSAANGACITNIYNNSPESSSSSLISVSPEFGKNAAIWMAVTVLAIVLIAIACSLAKYRLLGLVNTLMILSYTVALITALLIIGIEVTIAGVITAALGLAVMCFSNFFTFEAIRREAAVGRTIGASVKTGYKKSLFGVLDVHVILIIAAIIMTLVGAGELAACGLIFLIGSIASYVLYWFTRFMWYTISSLAKDKFNFCGFEREVEEDD